jgi:hypothetical protein
MKSKTAWTPSQAIRVRLAGLAVVAAASLVALLPAAAAATTPTAVSFSNTRQVVSVTPGPGTTFYTVSTRTSIASGPITGSFALVDQSAVHQTSPQNDGHFGTIHINSLLTSDTGTISIDIQGQFVSASPDGTETVQGHWTIAGGTGSYTGLHGTGTDDTTIDPATETITDTLTGFAFYPNN